MNEAANKQWGTRALNRQINAFYYEKLDLSTDKSGVHEEANENIRTL